MAVKDQGHIRRFFSRFTEPFQRRGVVLSLKIGGLCFLVGGAAVCGWLGWRSLAYRDEFMINPTTLSMEVPSWAKPELVNEIKAKSDLDRTFSLLEPGLAMRIAKAYERSPWVVKVNYVRKEFPNKIRMKFTLRKPITVIKTANDVHLVDEDGVVLQKSLYKWPDEQLACPFIQSSRLQSAPSPGKKWQDDAVRAGIDLVRFLKHNKVVEPLRIVAVDVTNLGRRRLTGESDIVLLTATQTAIKWGCSPLCREPKELSDWEKLQNLLSVFKAEGPNLSHIEYIDVRWHTPHAKRRDGAEVTATSDPATGSRDRIASGSRPLR
jgi:hypothetical protein